MKPGIYERLDFAEYLAIDAISNTALGNMARSPRHYRNAVELERAKPLVIGSLVHCGRLEPLAIAERYAVMPDYHLDPGNKTGGGEESTSKATRYVKELTAKFCEANRDKEIVSRDWYAEARAVVESLHADTDSLAALSADAYELSLVWEDDTTGLPCKARLDAVKHGSHITDLKTTADLTTFGKSFFRYGYYRQAAHYQDGWATLTGEVLPFYLSVVEKCQPYCVQTARVSDAAISFGREERQRLLTQIVECQANEEWPGPAAPAEWTLPEWATAGAPLDLIVNGEKVSL